MTGIDDVCDYIDFQERLNQDYEMAAIDEISEYIDFKESLKQKIAAGKWLQEQMQNNVELETIFEWFDDLNDDAELCVEKVVKYMQMVEPDNKATT